jgi:hypothetical protein
MRALPEGKTEMRPYDADLRKVQGMCFDHELLELTCERCAKRNKPDQCVYHPAPLTKGPTPQDSNSDQSSPRVNSFSTACHLSPSDYGVNRDLVYPESKRVKRAGAFQPGLSPDRLERQAERHDQHNLEDICKPLSGPGIRADALSYDTGAGFINHSAVLAEHELSIGIEPQNGDTVPQAKVSQLQIDRGAAVLKLFRDLQATEKYIEK